MKLNNLTLENSICFTFPQRVRIYNLKYTVYYILTETRYSDFETFE